MLSKATQRHKKSRLWVFLDLASLLVPLAIALYLVATLRIYRPDSWLGVTAQLPPLYWIGLFSALIPALVYPLARHRSDRVGRYIPVISAFYALFYLNAILDFVYPIYTTSRDMWGHMGETIAIPVEGNTYTTRGYKFSWPGLFLWASMLIEITGIDPILILSSYAFIYSTMLFIFVYAILSRFLDSPYVEYALLFYVTGSVFPSIKHYCPNSLSMLIFCSLIVLPMARFLGVPSKEERKNTLLVLLGLTVIVFTHAITAYYIMMLFLVSTILIFLIHSSKVMNFLDKVLGKFFHVGFLRQVDFPKTHFLLFVVFIALFAWALYGSLGAYGDIFGSLVKFISTIRHGEVSTATTVRLVEYYSPVQAWSVRLKLIYSIPFFISGLLGGLLLLKGASGVRGRKKFLVFASILLLAAGATTYSANLSAYGAYYERFSLFSMLPLSMIAIGCLGRRFAMYALVSVIIFGSILGGFAVNINEVPEHSSPSEVQGSSFIGKYGFTSPVTTTYFPKYHQYTGQLQQLDSHLHLEVMSKQVKTLYTYYGFEYLYLSKLSNLTNSNDLVYDNGHLMAFTS